MLTKRIINVEVQDDGRYLVKGDSYPTECTPELLESIKDRTDVLLVDNFEFPDPLPGKKRNVYWNPEKEVVEVEYLDKTFDEMDVYEQNAFLRTENTLLRDELELTQAALFELHAMITGGTENGND